MVKTDCNDWTTTARIPGQSDHETTCFRMALQAMGRGAALLEPDSRLSRSDAMRKQAQGYARDARRFLEAGGML